MTYHIHHFDAHHDAHGPVEVYLSDSGRLAFVCSVDQAAWELTIPLVQAPEPAVDDAGENMPVDRREAKEPVDVVRRLWVR
jgi:hypothetical protein